MDYLSFQLADTFTTPYANKTVPWGFAMGGGNHLGELIFLRTYSRLKDDGSKERWHEVCNRVISGSFSLMKDHATQQHIPWDEGHAQTNAQEAFDRMFNFQWLPPGRGLWMMGTEFVHTRRDGAALNNCGFTSTDDFARDTAWLMEAAMLGVGVGFDTKGAGSFDIAMPDGTYEYVIPDTRQGWAKSVELLLNAYQHGHGLPQMNYSEIRDAGTPIKGFGGVASGPVPLIALHDQLGAHFASRVGKRIDSMDILDTMNLTGKCVVSGNVRRMAEIALGDSSDLSFLDAKSMDLNPKRNDWLTGWGHISNNTIFAEVGATDYDAIAERAAVNGEPGVFYLDLARKFGRLIDPANDKDARIAGTNPCGEQSLESRELCCLVETFPTNAEDFDDYAHSLKWAFLYGKSVTLLGTTWEDTNRVMLRNRRIGTSMSGLAQFVEERSMSELQEWMDRGYESVNHWDEVYSEWLCIRESIKKTSIKPSGTVSLLAGVTPGVHWPVQKDYIRRVRVANHDALIPAAKAAGYPMEPCLKDPEGTTIIEFPVETSGTRTQEEVSIWEKASLATLAQKYWADNQVSCTLTFKADEADQIGHVLRVYEGQFKAVSFLPILTADNTQYKQLPYEGVTREEYDDRAGAITQMDLAAVYSGTAGAEDALGEKYCTTDVCEISYS